MEREEWVKVDRYLEGVVGVGDAGARGAMEESQKAGLAEIAVSPVIGKFLMVLGMARGAKRILEIGTLGGYSTIWLGRAVGNGGKVVTLEVDAKHAEVARGNIARAGLENVVEIIVGEAMGSLERMGREGVEAFDLVFIDADKVNTPGYFEWAMRLGRPGTVIVVDNVVREGKVLDEKSEDGSVKGIRRFLEMLGENADRVEATALQVVGVKGWDGVVVGVVKEMMKDEGEHRRTKFE